MDKKSFSPLKSERIVPYLAIPKKQKNYKVIMIRKDSFILTDEKEKSGITIKKTSKNKDWKIGDVVPIFL